ncbi:hypothetical protein [Amycolatopsis nalaikhensis]|uniref:Uncharacterized protein n=1 Tax=Amycolatopsis nalaikhensis TaxID=715472 RepID=A0ABY8X982_9PSEU|nr:hypothetical protein [Amycolatopsis sp. 2-2]WIV52857.1 hypothetical protein QP939_28350 [Amycolatopsis sp. 2-2]
MRTFHDILADINRELAAADMIPTDTPATVAAYLRELLTRHVQTLPAPNGGTIEILPAAAIRLELHYLTDYAQP